MVNVKEILSQNGFEDAAFEAKIISEIAQKSGESVEVLLEKRLQNYPLQYLAGEWDFLNFTLKIGEGVLIPRADTECVVEAAINIAKTIDNLKIIDLCSGSGAIAIGLSRFVKNAEVTAVELSDVAYEYLCENVKNLAPQIKTVKADVFSYQKNLQSERFDMIISNPPYLTHDEMQNLQKELEFEPKMALEADDNGLAFYRHIANEYKFALKKGGAMVFEIGDTQGESVKEILQNAGFENVKVERDYGANNRVAIGFLSLQ